MKIFIFLTFLIQMARINAQWPFSANPFITNIYKNMQLSGFADGLKPLGLRQRITQDAMMKPGYGRKLNGLLRSGQSSTLPATMENEEEHFDTPLPKRRKTSTTTTTTTTSTTSTTTTTTTTTTKTTKKTTTKTTPAITITKKNYRKPMKLFYKPKYISLNEMSIAEKHKNSLLNLLKADLNKNRNRRPTVPEFSERRKPLSLLKTHDLSNVETKNLQYRIRPQSTLNHKNLGTLVIVNNNNNNNNLIQGLDPIELERFLRAHQDMTIDDLLNSNITERLKEFFELDQKEINEYIEYEKATGLARKQPVYKFFDLRAKQSDQPLKYTYYPNANGGVIVINNSNNNNNDFTIRKILSGEGINVNNNNEGVALNLPPEDIERLLKNAIIVNNDNNNNNAN